MSQDRVIVLGGGMAGLAATRHLVISGHNPLLIAPATTVHNRGETLSPKAVPFLDSLGWSHLLHPQSAFEGRDRFSVWGTPYLRKSPNTQLPGHHIDRAKIEAEMAFSLAGTERLYQTAIRLDHLPHGVRVHLESGATIEAGVLIDCTGRAALSAGEAANRKRLDKLVAAWRVFDIPDDAETLAASLVETVDLGWWYISPMPGQRLMVSIFTDSDLLPPGTSREPGVWASRIEKATITNARLESLGLLHTIGNAHPLLAPAATVIGSNLLEGRILRAGDAASALDPLAANGLATALWSGLTAADAAIALTRGDQGPAQAYEHAFLEGIAGQLASQNALYQTERRFPDAPFWQRRQKR